MFPANTFDYFFLFKEEKILSSLPEQVTPYWDIKKDKFGNIL